MITYEIITNEYKDEILKRCNENGTISWIPLDPTNADYQAYLNKDNPEYGKPTQL